MAQGLTIADALRALMQQVQEVRNDYLAKLAAAQRTKTASLEQSDREAKAALQQSDREAKAAEGASRSQAHKSIEDSRREHESSLKEIQTQRTQSLAEASARRSQAIDRIRASESKMEGRRGPIGCGAGFLSYLALGTLAGALATLAGANPQDWVTLTLLPAGLATVGVYFAFPHVTKRRYGTQVEAIELSHATETRQIEAHAKRQSGEFAKWLQECERHARSTSESEVNAAQAMRMQRDGATQALYQAQVASSEKSYQAQVASSAQALAAVGQVLAKKSETLVTSVGFAATPWNPQAWAAWTSATSIAAVARVGELRPGSGQHPLSLPALVPFLGSGPLVFAGAGAAREQFVAWLPGALIRLLAASTPGRVQLTLVDPVSRGQNVASLMPLRKSADWLVGGQVWTEPRHIEQRLVEHTERIEEVIRTYLHPPFETLADYNATAAVQQGYRVLVVVDFPAGFSEDAQQRLVSIAKNGPRCGVVPIILVDTSALQANQGHRRVVTVADLAAAGVLVTAETGALVLSGLGLKQCPVELEGPPPPPIVDRVLAEIAAKADSGRKVMVGFESIASPPDQWWGGSTNADLCAPLGYHGTAVQELVFGRGTAHHGLVAGRPGSGKTSLFHTLILGLATCYAPDEVELYLIDFKKGIEFKVYAEHHLPHARVIAIDSDREFGLSILQKLDQEYRDRGDLLRGSGSQLTDITVYRQKTGKRLTRILLVIDEFHELFMPDDSIAARCREILERLVKEGRGVGMHVLLGSQSLAGSSIHRSTADQMGVRIALQCSEADSRLILSDDNGAARTLANPGEAIYNDRNGLVEGNRHFQVAIAPEETRTSILQRVSELARTRPDRLRPDGSLRVFEGNEKAMLDGKLTSELKALAASADGRIARAWLGEPIAVRSEPVAARLRRQSAANLLIVGQDEPAALAMMTTSIVSIVAQVRRSTWPAGHHGLYLLDFGSQELPQAWNSAWVFEQMLPRLPIPAQIGRRKELPNILARLAEEVKHRNENDQAPRPPVYLLFHGLQRARDLRNDDDSSRYDSSAGPTLGSQLTLLLKEGPDVGMHTIAWCDAPRNLSRSLERGTSREFSLRVAMQMSREDSQSIIDSPAAGDLGPNRALFVDEEVGRPEKFRPFEVPSMSWIEGALRQIG